MICMLCEELAFLQLCFECLVHWSKGLKLRYQVSWPLIRYFIRALVCTAAGPPMSLPASIPSLCSYEWHSANICASQSHPADLMALLTFDESSGEN